MRKFITLAGAAALGLGLQGAHAYNATASVTFTVGGSNNSAGADQGFVPTANPIAIGGGIVPNNDTMFHAATGANSTGWYNTDFTTALQCPLGSPPDPGGSISVSTRKYGCRYTNGAFTQTWVPSTPGVDPGPVSQATGTITLTSTTLTGTLTIVNTSDEPTGATTIIGTGDPAFPTRLSNSVGDGFAGYNYRTADGSPFGAVWYGITNAGTYTLNLTGTFSPTTWNITGGSATFTDPGFACQQGGVGGANPNGTLCLVSAVNVGGSFNPDGSHLSWGMDPDGAGGPLGVAAIQLRDHLGAAMATLSGVRANLSVAGNGTITTNSGETRKALGNSSGCSDHLQFNTVNNELVCGNITSGQLVVTGTVPDTDADGINNGADNCRTVANPTQVDTNGDGFGNICDADINNSGLVTTADFNLLRSVLNQACPGLSGGGGTGANTTPCNSDMNASGLVTTADFNLLRARLNSVPGPSGLTP